MNVKNYYQCCAVPCCVSTTIKTPTKLFIHVPVKTDARNKWLKLARINVGNISEKSNLFFCEDHFDLPNDMENYMEYHLLGSVKRILMKRTCLPSKFACQSDGGKRATIIPQGFYSKRQRIELVKSLLKAEKENETKKTRRKSKRLSGPSSAGKEVQLNLQMSAPTLKQESMECVKEEESPNRDNMNPPEPLESPEYVNYYDNKHYVFIKLEEEFPEDDCSQLDCSLNSDIVFENKELSTHIDKQEIQYENLVDGLPLVIKEDNVTKMYQVTIKTERLEEEDILYNAGATSIHYDVLVTPREVQCKLCCRIFKNSFDLLKHNNGHLKIEISTPVG